MADPNKLPTLDDFQEDSNTLLKSNQETKPDTSAATKEAAEKAAKEADDKAKADAAKAEADAKAKADADKVKAEAEAKKKEEEKKKAEANKPADLPKEQEEALIKKAEEKPETLTAEERKYLLDKGLFEEEKPSPNIWEEVEKIHGIKVEVDYAGKDPESAEGLALRDQALVNLAAAEQLKYLETTYPDAYQILEHVANGGKVTDLINADEPDFSKITLDKDNKDDQKELLMNFYLQKGFDEASAKRYVEADEDSKEGLFTVASNALKQLQTSQAERQKQILEEQKVKKAADDKRNETFKQSIKQITDSGKLGEFNITSKKDRDEFYQFAVKNIYSDGKNGYQIVLPVTDKTVVPVLQQMFFGFKNGKLDEFVNKAAASQNLVKLKRKVAQGNNAAGGQENNEQKNNNQKTLPTFDSFKAE